jgi:glycosyltransferase involved in cell wall biosynthesis
MKILYVSHCLPYPLTDGFRVHLYHLLKELSNRHEIHLVCFESSPHERGFASEVEPFCRSTTVIMHSFPQQSWKRILSMMVDEHPFCIDQFSSGKMADAVGRLAQDIRPDVVQFDHTPMAQYERFLPPELPKVFLPHDALSMLFETSYQNEPNLARKFYFWNQFRKLKRFEARVLPRFQKTIVVSPVDQAVLQSECPTAAIEWDPLGVDADFFVERPDLELDDVILFRGIMDFFPNHDAAHFFVDEVLPLIWRDRPTAEFWVAGPKTLPSLRRRAHGEPRIKLMGFVEDLRNPMAAATVLVCPMRSGSGMKTKILESLAMAKAIVATPRSLAGIAVQDEREVLVGDTAEALARQTLRLLGDRALRHRLGQAGRTFVTRHHSWSVHADFFERIYTEAASRKEHAGSRRAVVSR